MYREFHILWTINATISLQSALALYVQKVVAKISVALWAIQSDLRQVRRSRKMHAHLIASGARSEMWLSDFSASVMEKYEGQLSVRSLRSARTTLPLLLMKTIAAFVLASEPRRKWKDSDTASAIKAFNSNLATLTKSLNETMICRGSRHSPRGCGAFQRAPQFVGIDVVNGIRFPARYLPDIAFGIQGLVGKQPEKNLRSATGISHTASGPQTSTCSSTSRSDVIGPPRGPRVLAHSLPLPGSFTFATKRSYQNSTSPDKVSVSAPSKPSIRQTVSTSSCWKSGWLSR